MDETEPKYIKKLKDDLINHFDKKLEKEIGDLALSTANEFRLIREEMATKEELQELKRTMVTKDDIKDMVTKEDMKDILSHIGRYEVRALNIEHILTQDHKPRIISLEKKVFK